MFKPCAKHLIDMFYAFLPHDALTLTLHMKCDMDIEALKTTERSNNLISQLIMCRVLIIQSAHP